MALSTVTMTREAVRRAWEARKLHLALQHPPETGFEALLKRGAFPGINDVDWRNATEWFGHCRACTIGKIKERPAPGSTAWLPSSTEPGAKSGASDLTGSRASQQQAPKRRWLADTSTYDEKLDTQRKPKGQYKP
jgi:hypothetical protein